MSKMNEDGSFQGIDYTDLSRTAGFPHRHHTYDLVYLARAYKNQPSKYYRNQKLKEIIIRGFKYWVDNDFFGDNWHNNQISTPTNLVNLMLIIGEELPQDLVNKSPTHYWQSTYECFRSQAQWRSNRDCRNFGKKFTFYW